MSNNRNRDKDTYATGRRNTPKGDRPSKMITKRGFPKLQENVPGHKTFVGTPSWVKAAATRAEGLAKSMPKDFGGGHQEAARHRIPDDHYSAGKPDYAKKQSPAVRDDTGRGDWKTPKESH